jgi:pimeloyl-ACP methyl ester carboxylesterase
MSLRPLFLASSLMALCLAPPLHAATRTLGTIEFSPCTLTSAMAAVPVEAQCGSYSVPENRDAPEGRRIELAIAMIPAEGDAAPDPVFMLAGGPGQSARDSYPSVRAAFAHILKQRHVILLDQRGTGGSNLLNCPQSDAPDTDDSPEAAVASARKCADELSKQADLRFYTTTDAIQDLEDVRAALGAEQVDLVGISYGTRVAQQYMKRHPDRVRAAILDGVAPNSLVLGQDHAKNLDASLAAQFARCRDVPACNDSFGDPRERYAAIARQLDEQPLQLSYRDAATGEVKDGTLSRGMIAAVLRMYAYQPVMASTLPLLIHEIEQGHADAALAQASWLMSSLSDSMAQGMSQSVTCSEDVDELTIDLADAQTVLGTQFVELVKAACAEWPRGARPADFREPVTAPIPTLLLSGEFDPVTPPRYGEEVARHLPNARHLVLRGQGHNVVGAGCMPKLVAKFLETADPAAPEAECLEQLPYAPPFVGYYGWEP